MYIVIEIQTNTDDTVGTLVNTYTDVNVAEQKYHTILASAAVSAIPYHAAVILTETGQLVKHQCYCHVEESEAG